MIYKIIPRSIVKTSRLPVYMIKTKVAFMEGRQSEQSEKFSKSPEWLEKSRFCFDYVNMLLMLL